MSSARRHTRCRNCGTLLGALLCTVLIHAACLADDLRYPSVCDSLRDAVYAFCPLAVALRHYYVARSAVQAEVQNRAQRLYWLSRVEYLAGRAEQNGERTREAERHFRKALEHIDASLEDSAYSDGYRMKSEALGQICRGKAERGNVVYLMAKGPSVNKLARKAIELDPRNGKAHVQLASSRVYPPRLYGGNPKEGIELMLKALTMPDIEKDDRYNIYLAVGIAHDKLGNREGAREYLRKALALYPTNRFGLQTHRKLEGTEDP